MQESLLRHIWNSKSIIFGVLKPYSSKNSNFMFTGHKWDLKLRLLKTKDSQPHNQSFVLKALMMRLKTPVFTFEVITVKYNPITASFQTQNHNFASLYYDIPRSFLSQVAVMVFHNLRTRLNRLSYRWTHATDPLPNDGSIASNWSLFNIHMRFSLGISVI